MRRNDSPVTLSRKLLRIGIGVVALVVPIAPSAEGQTFDVTSVKPNKSAPDERSRMSFALGGRFTATNVTLRELIRIAYGMPGNPLRDLQIVGGPDWLAGDRFDIEATAATATGPTDPNRQLRLRALLSDRFKLAVRNEMRDLPLTLWFLTGPTAGWVSSSDSHRRTVHSPGTSRRSHQLLRAARVE